MADDRPASEVASVAHCPWCSAPLESTGAATCPSCGATLTADSEPQLPGVTTVAPSSISRAAQRRPSRIVQWITGDSGEAPAPPLSVPAPGSLTPPAADVRVEMLRLELAARLADRTAEIEALETEARLEAGPDAVPDAVPPVAEVGVAAPPDEPPGAPAVATNQRPSTWAELDGTPGREPPTDAGPREAVMPESTVEGTPAAGPDPGADESADAERHT